MRSVALTVCLAVLAFSRLAAAEPPAARSPPMNLVAPPTLAFVHGPSTADLAGLRAWLDRQDAVVRLPVLVTLGVARTAVAKARVLSHAKVPLEVTLDDAQLGISLADRARTACPGVDDCALWLEGRWRDGGLAVTRVVGPLKPGQQGGVLFSFVEVPEGALELAAVLELMGSSATRNDKQAAVKKLEAAGREAVPLLVASLADPRRFEQIGRTVAQKCDDLLYALVTPTDVAPTERVKVANERVLEVKDWRAFWAARKDRSLEAIHDELRPLVRAYWDAKGVTQQVP